MFVCLLCVGCTRACMPRARWSGDARAAFFLVHAVVRRFTPPTPARSRHHVTSAPPPTPPTPATTASTAEMRVLQGVTTAIDEEYTALEGAVKDVGVFYESLDGQRE